MKKTQKLLLGKNNKLPENKEITFNEYYHSFIRNIQITKFSAFAYEREKNRNHQKRYTLKKTKREVQNIVHRIKLCSLMEVILQVMIDLLFLTLLLELALHS